MENKNESLFDIPTLRQMVEVGVNAINQLIKLRVNVEYLDGNGNSMGLFGNEYDSRYPETFKHSLIDEVKYIKYNPNKLYVYYVDSFISDTKWYVHRAYQGVSYDDWWYEECFSPRYIGCIETIDDLYKIVKKYNENKNKNHPDYLKLRKKDIEDIKSELEFIKQINEVNKECDE